MKADLDLFYNSIQSMTREDLLLLAVEQYKQLDELKLHQAENSRIETEIHIQYSQLKDDYEKLQKNFDAIAKDNAKLHDRLNLKNKAIFGSHTEKLLSVINKSTDTEEFEDESQLEDDYTDTSPDDTKIVNLGSYKEGKNDSGKTDNSGKSKDKKNAKNLASRKSRLKESAHKLPRMESYHLDVAALDAKYGKGNWSIVFWKSYETIEKIPFSEYLNVVFEPVIECNNEYISNSYDNKLIPHSLVSPSLLASVLYRKFVLGLPFFRQAADFSMHGLELSKQTIINWVNKLAIQILQPISEYLLNLLTMQQYLQSDETYLLVLKDGRAAGTKSFMWVHCTSELSEENPIVVFCFELTRSTEHLRKIFGDFAGYMTCDAYVSYSVMEKESDGLFAVSGCLMHARRYLSEALFVNDTKDMSEDELKALPEVKALLIISEIYHKENELKALSPEDRKQQRQSQIKPLMDKFFTYIHELEGSGEVFSDRMQKAIRYAVNQEPYLRRFLNDGNIPIDNGQSERYIRSYSIGRANWIFADTKLGAEVNAICYTLAETAKANKVNPELYFRYLLEEVPKHLDDADDSWKADMTPWSDAYQRYEARMPKECMEFISEIASTPVKPVVKKQKLHEPDVDLMAAQ